MRRLQRYISRSRMAMPVTSVVAFLLWIVAYAVGHSDFLTFLVLGCSAMMIMWINHLFALLRVYSRMISSAFVAISVALVVTPNIPGYSVLTAVAQFCLLVFFLLLFSCYQYKKAAGVILYAFLMLGVTSVFFKQILFFIPLLWALTAYCMMTSNSKIVLSSIFGILLPYVYLAAYYLVFEGLDSPMPLLSNWDFCRVADFRYADASSLFSFIATTLLCGFGINHYVREGHKDKVRTRMMFHILIYVAIYAFIIALLQPKQLELMTGLMIISASALTGHYITFTDTRNSNAVTIALIAAAILISIVNLSL